MNLMKFGIHHLGFVFKDLEKAVTMFSTEFGISGFSLYTFTPQSAWYLGEQLPGFSLRIGMLQITDGSTFELVQPLSTGKSLFRDFLDAGKEGLHHTCFSTDAFDDWKRQLEDKGNRILFQVETEDERIGYRRGMFFNAKDSNTVFEIREIPYFRK